MKYFVVIDTNVLVSAVLKYNSIPGTIIEFAFNGKIVPVLNKEIESEYRNVLLRPKFHLTTDIVDDIINEFKQKGLYINENHIDVVFYEVVMEQRGSTQSWLVTGNIKHFPNETFIVTPRQMLDIILNEDMD